MVPNIVLSWGDVHDSAQRPEVVALICVARSARARLFAYVPR